MENECRVVRASEQGWRVQQGLGWVSLGGDGEGGAGVGKCIYIYIDMSLYIYIYIIYIGIHTPGSLAPSKAERRLSKSVP